MGFLLGSTGFTLSAFVRLKKKYIYIYVFGVDEPSVESLFTWKLLERQWPSSMPRTT